MKNLLFVLILLLSMPSIGQTYGWELQQSPTTNQLNDVFFADLNHGWAIGFKGEIICTTNGGISWFRQISGTLKTLRSLCFTDSLTGHIVGDSGTVLRTTNGGNSWTSLNLYGAGLWDMTFQGKQNGWIVGWGGWIFRTTDGGQTWPSMWHLNYQPLMSVHFVNPRNGWAVGTHILRTSNGGETWDSIGTGTGQQTSVFFADSLHGWIGTGNTNPVLKKSTNGGLSWIPESGVANSVQNLFFIDNQTGWSIAFGMKKTTNGGLTWVQQFPEEETAKAVAIHFVDAQNGWAVGRNGTILHTSTGGVASTHKTIVPPSFSINPNPASESVLLNCTAEIRSIRLVDVLGRDCQIPPWKAGELELNIRDLKTGVYVLHVQTSAGSMAQRLLKQ